MLLAEIATGTILILIALVALPLGALAFATGAGKALREIGKGDFAMDHDLQRSQAAAPAPVSSQVREEEIRQMVQARSDRSVARGEAALDVEAEVQRLLAPGQELAEPGADRELREEVRQLVVARNERRLRQGKEPLDVEREIERQLRDLEDLGQ